MVELTGGRWIRDKWGVARWVPNASTRVPRRRPTRAKVDVPTKAAPPRKPQKFAWVERTLLKAHAAYSAGRRDEWAREGERIYSRRRKRVQRAERRAA